MSNVTRATDHTLYKGYDPILDLDLLLTIWDSGSVTLAVRDGLDQRWLRWGPPITLEPTS